MATGNALKARFDKLQYHEAFDTLSEAPVVLHPPPLPLTRAPPGRQILLPLPDFLDSSKTAADIETKLLVSFPALI